MRRTRGILSSALVVWSAASLAFAGPKEGEGPIEPDPARPAIGEWIGTVSWNEPIVSYAWSIYPDGAFSSGRLGRGANGGGAWSTNGAHLTLKYSDHFRYEGELSGDWFSGDAYTATGQTFGSFSMHRVTKTIDAPE